jgi:hypothetical protein
MSVSKDRTGLLRQGLFAKYVIALVGLVIFVLAVNGLTETWINYRATRTALTGAMADKAEATARRSSTGRTTPSSWARSPPSSSSPSSTVRAARCCGCRAPRW